MPAKVRDIAGFSSGARILPKANYHWRNGRWDWPTPVTMECGGIFSRQARINPLSWISHSSTLLHSPTLSIIIARMIVRLHSRRVSHVGQQRKLPRHPPPRCFRKYLDDQHGIRYAYAARFSRSMKKLEFHKHGDHKWSHNDLPDEDAVINKSTNDPISSNKPDNQLTAEIRAPLWIRAMDADLKGDYATADKLFQVIRTFEPYNVSMPLLGGDPQGAHNICCCPVFASFLTLGVVVRFHS
ncbi:hypothetical protein KEM48_011248 [Puccinia striiformis f. sp. tritici PST-130]|nr:hypothetical protein KEM48_011248 [Puccinia striiformis f. sp. tritici PST-130]